MFGTLIEHFLATIKVSIPVMRTRCVLLTLTRGWPSCRWADWRRGQSHLFMPWLATAALVPLLIGGWLVTDWSRQSADAGMHEVPLDRAKQIARSIQPEGGTSVSHFDQDHGNSTRPTDPNPGTNTNQHHSVRIGVLANRGKEICLLEWAPTANYLSAQLSPRHFEIVPLDFDEVHNAAEQRSVEFLLVNPSMYVALEYHGLVYRIATFQQPSVKGDGPLPVFGGVIFCRADRSDIQSLRDLVGKRFAAVSPDSTGGWHAAWREFEHLGIHPQTDFTHLVFSGTHDAVVEAVRSGQADGGTVRSTQLERMELEGAIDLREFRVLKGPSASSSDYTFLLSTRLYPEWPFAAVKGTDLELGKSVASALLRMGTDDAAAQAARGAGWAIPQDYASLHECLRELRLAPYENYGKVTVGQTIAQYWGFILGTLAVTLTILILAFLTWRRGVRLKNSSVALRENAEKMNSIFRAAPTGIGVVVNRIIMEANDRLCEMTGYTREELIGENARLFYPSDEDFAYVGCEKYRQISNKGTGTVVTRWRRKDGETINILLSSTPIAPDDHSVGVTFTALDITERKRAEEALSLRESYLTAIIENQPGLVWLKDKERCFLAVNHAFARSCGMVSPEEVLGKTDLDIWPRELAEKYRADDEEVMTRGAPIAIEEPIFDQGEMKWFETFKIPVLDKGGQILGTSGYARDITERKQAEEALRESQERFRELAELLPETIFEMDTSGKLSFVNQNAFTHFGFSPEDFERGLNGFEMVSPEDRPRAIENAARVLRGEKIGLSEYKAIRKDGSTFPVIMHSSAKVHDGKPVGLRGIVIDITETKKLEAQLRQAHKMEAIGTLAGGIAHDFNNLLHAVQGYAELLLLSKTDGEEGYKELREISRAAKRGGELTRQLLTFSRKVESKLQPVDLNQTVDEVRMLLERTIPKMIKVELHLMGNLCRVNADASQIEQILMNLALNARDAMVDGGTLTIETKNFLLHEGYRDELPELTPGKYVLLGVSDTGHGMDKMTLEHIFDPFFTTKGVGKGTGLGLAMVYGIIKNHHGQITCASKPGEGTAFTIYLPAIEQLEESPGASAEASEPHGGSETVLLVDDDDPIRNLGERILRMFGYTVISAPDGESALQTYREERDRIDLVVLDLIMPGMGGVQCLQKLLEINPQAKVVIASGYSVPGELERVTEVGAKVFINKPYDARQMLKVVREVLD